MRIVTRLEIAVLVLVMVVGGSFVVAFGSLLGGAGDQCSGQGARLAALDRLDAFAVTPSGSQEVKGSADTAECVGEDSTDAWLSGSRLYTYGGNREDLIDFYTRELSRLGWEREGPGRGSADVRTCFTRRSESGWETLTITFRQGAEADGTFQASAEAAMDGSKIGC
ncbi:hypothetical protein [Kitasatospora sp. NPDC056184]|uniref:hypothetical protein n=1 Tax=Kitasatospora sp. NPDC056184 TaxID=3345738 RepID=UPI0035DCC7CA